MKSKIVQALILKTISILFCSNMYAQTNRYQLKIQVQNLKLQGSNLVIKIWSNGNYMNNNPYREIKVKSEAANNLIVEVDDLSTGEYGISMFQDINNNNKLDKSWIGKPTEPCGFSNNAKTNFGPPSFDEIKFLFKNNMKISISLNQ
jgi:uncharacterized protein (DUF2141 family)